MLQGENTNCRRNFRKRDAQTATDYERMNKMAVKRRSLGRLTYRIWTAAAAKKNPRVLQLRPFETGHGRGNWGNDTK